MLFAATRKSFYDFCRLLIWKFLSARKNFSFWKRRRRRGTAADVYRERRERRFGRFA